MGYRLKPAGNSFMGQHLTSLSSSFSSSSPSFSTQDSGNLSARTTPSAKSRGLLPSSSYLSSHSTNMLETKPLFLGLTVSHNQNHKEIYVTNSLMTLTKYMINDINTTLITSQVSKKICLLVQYIN